MREAQTAIARHLKTQYGLSDPIPDRLAELLRRLEGTIDNNGPNSEGSGPVSPHRTSFAMSRRASPQSAAVGQLEAIAILMRRTLMRTSAPILRNLRRRVPQVASEYFV